MYSGTTLHERSGNLLGAHQKFDRVARRFVEKLRPGIDFPTAKQILHFEGNNGPDGIKRKSPAVDEPWHYWDPLDTEDQKLLDIVHLHQAGLVEALVKKDQERAAFEAAWLAHAIVDSLTPPHHYPYEKKLTELRGEGIETRTSIKEKIFIKGDTRRQMISKNWQLWGAKGLIISHASFEWGVSTALKPMKLLKGLPTEAELKHALNIGYDTYLREQAMEIYELNMYERYLRFGWTMKLGREITRELGPRIVKCVTIAWLIAIDEAGDN